MKQREPKFDIFSGEIHKDAVWLETVTGFDQARMRMEQIAALQPGRYFIYCSVTNSVVAHVERRAKAPLRHKSKSSSA
jgi:hypothetical protein